jgi:hypothetical protein
VIDQIKGPKIVLALSFVPVGFDHHESLGWVVSQPCHSGLSLTEDHAIFRPV